MSSILTQLPAVMQRLGELERHVQQLESKMRIASRAANVQRLTPSATVRIPGFEPVDTDRILVLENATQGYGIILERESSLAPASSRFIYPRGIPVILRPSQSAAFAYDPVVSRWQLLCGPHGHSQFEVNSDFHNATAPFMSIVSGTGAAVTAAAYLVNSTENPNGVIQCSSGTTATGRAYIGSPVSNFLVPAQGNALFLSRVAVQLLSNGTERFQARVGLHDGAATADVTDGVYWEYDDTASTLWRICAANNSVRTKSSVTGLTVDLNYVWLGIFLNAGWSRADFFYSADSALWKMAGSVSTNLPTSSRLVQIGSGITKTVGTTARLFSVDFLGFSYDVNRG